MAHLWWAVGAVVFLIVLYNSFVNVKGDQVATLERRWIGREMPDGRTVALSGEVGVQARILGPGLHLLIPFIFKSKKSDYTVIRQDEVGLLEAITGAPIASGEIFGKLVECSLFGDGEAFLKNGGQKGPQLAILPPGEHRINPHLFKVNIVKAVVVNDDQIGVVEAVAGRPIPAGRIIADPVDCSLFTDANAFLKNGGQKGPQVQILPPGMYRINREMFKVQVNKATVIPGGHIGLITAMDGAQIPAGRLLADKVDGHKNFEIGEAFIANGGQKGRQIDHLMPGTYRINPLLFEVSAPQPWFTVGSEDVGIVTILEGKPIMDPSNIAAKLIPLEKHNNFQDASAFISNDGEKGLQIPVLRAGSYAINPWFAEVRKQKMVQVNIGECAVVTSFVGDEGQDTSNEDVNARIVDNGKRGIWKDPLQPGRHALNLQICKVDIVPTTQILLSWADDESSAHKFDNNLKTITLRTADAFNVNMDVRVIIHISMADAPKVVANLGSVENMISQVLEPAISSHFRNAAQAVQALELYTKRSELQAKAKQHIQDVLKFHHIESKDTMIADVVLPIELTKTVTDRQIAEQEKKTYFTQREAQEERRAFENATAQANMQPKVVESERGVDIAKNHAEAAVQSANGKAEASKLEAAADATNMEVRANGKAKAVRLEASATAEATTAVGTAEAGVIQSKGEATAEAYKMQVAAMGQDNFGRLKVIEQIADGNVQLIPNPKVLMIGGSGEGGGSRLESLVALGMMDKIMGIKDDLKTDDVIQAIAPGTKPEQPKEGTSGPAKKA